MYKEEKEIWLQAFCAAISGAAQTVGARYMAQPKVDNPEDMITEDDIIEDDCAQAAAYADECLHLFYDKFRGC